MEKVKRLSWISAALFGCYLLTYLALSLGGQYTAKSFPHGGSIHTYLLPDGSFDPIYTWCPHEFYNHAGDRWRKNMVLLFFPLWWCDITWWHTSSKAKSGHYPVLVPPLPQPRAEGTPQNGQ